MSTFSQQTKHPVTGEWHEATWMDDFYGRHRYGVRFPSGETFNPDKIQLETREDEPLESTTKERFEDAYQRFQLCDEISALDMKKLWAFIEKETALAYEQGRNAKGSSFRLGYEAGRSEGVAEERANVVESMMMEGIEAKMTPFQTTVNQYLRNRAEEIGIDIRSLNKPLPDKE